MTRRSLFAMLAGVVAGVQAQACGLLRPRIAKPTDTSPTPRAMMTFPINAKMRLAFDTSIEKHGVWHQFGGDVPHTIIVHPEMWLKNRVRFASVLRCSAGMAEAITNRALIIRGKAL
jgi:hypothetical protein